MINEYVDIYMTFYGNTNIEETVLFKPHMIDKSIKDVKVPLVTIYKILPRLISRKTKLDTIKLLLDKERMWRIRKISNVDGKNHANHNLFLLKRYFFPENQILSVRNVDYIILEATLDSKNIRYDKQNKVYYINVLLKVEKKENISKLDFTKATCAERRGTINRLTRKLFNKEIFKDTDKRLRKFTRKHFKKPKTIARRLKPGEKPFITEREQNKKYYENYKKRIMKQRQYMKDLYQNNYQYPMNKMASLPKNIDYIPTPYLKPKSKVRFKK